MPSIHESNENIKILDNNVNVNTYIAHFTLCQAKWDVNLLENKFHLERTYTRLFCVSVILFCAEKHFLQFVDGNQHFVPVFDVTLGYF